MSDQNELSEDEIEKLAEKLEALEEAEEAYKGWKDKRKELHREIADIVPTKREGSKTSTLELPDGREAKIKTTSRLYYNVDEDAWGEVEGELPEGYEEVVYEKTKLKVDKKKFRWIRDNAPEVFGKVSKAVTTNPGKPGVKIKKLGEKG